MTSPYDLLDDDESTLARAFNPMRAVASGYQQADTDRSERAASEAEGRAFSERQAAEARRQRRVALGLPEAVGVAEPTDLENTPAKYGYAPGRPMPGTGGTPLPAKTSYQRLDEQVARGERAPSNIGEDVIAQRRAAVKAAGGEAKYAAEKERNAALDREYADVVDDQTGKALYRAGVRAHAKGEGAGAEILGTVRDAAMGAGHAVGRLFHGGVKVIRGLDDGSAYANPSGILDERPNATQTGNVKDFDVWTDIAEPAVAAIPSLPATLTERIKRETSFPAAGPAANALDIAGQAGMFALPGLLHEAAGLRGDRMTAPEVREAVGPRNAPAVAPPEAFVPGLAPGLAPVEHAAPAAADVAPPPVTPAPGLAVERDPTRPAATAPLPPEALGERPGPLAPPAGAQPTSFMNRHPFLAPTDPSVPPEVRARLGERFGQEMPSESAAGDARRNRPSGDEQQASEATRAEAAREAASPEGRAPIAPSSPEHAALMEEAMRGIGQSAMRGGKGRDLGGLRDASGKRAKAEGPIADIVNKALADVKANPPTPEQAAQAREYLNATWKMGMMQPLTEADRAALTTTGMTEERIARYDAAQARHELGATSEGRAVVPVEAKPAPSAPVPGTEPPTLPPEAAREQRGTAPRPPLGSDIDFDDAPDQSFETSQGSVYVASEGRTTRTKSEHQGHVPSDAGAKQRSDRTIYVSPDMAREIGMWGGSSANGKRLVMRYDGTLDLLSENPATGKTGRDRIVASDKGYSFRPAVGRSPVELWGDRPDGSFKAVHAGNPIVRFVGAEETPRPPPEGTTAPAPSVEAKPAPLRERPAQTPERAAQVEKTQHARDIFREARDRRKAIDASREAFLRDNGEVPFEVPYKLGKGTVIRVTKSAAEPGKWQATFFDDRGPSGDIRRDSYPALIEEIQQHYGAQMEMATAGKPKTVPLPGTAAPEAVATEPTGEAPTFSPEAAADVRKTAVANRSVGPRVDTAFSRTGREKLVKTLRAEAEKAIAREAATPEASHPEVAKAMAESSRAEQILADAEIALEALPKKKGGRHSPERVTAQGVVEQAKHRKEVLDAVLENVRKKHRPDPIVVDLGAEGRFSIERTPEAIASVLARIEKPSEAPLIDKWRNGERGAGISILSELPGAVRDAARAWDRGVDAFLDRTKFGAERRPHVKAIDADVANGLRLLDNAPTYLRLKAEANLRGVVEGLDRPQERLAALMSDAQSREHMRTAHPDEYDAAVNDPAVMRAVDKYRVLQQELTAAHKELGGAALEGDYLRRVYENHLYDPAKDKGGDARTAFDRVVRPQRIKGMSREASAEWFHTNGAHQFKAAYELKFLSTKLRVLHDRTAKAFTAEATKVNPGAARPASIDYLGEKYYAPDANKPDGAKTYATYNPKVGEKTIIVDKQAGTSTTLRQPTFLGPEDVVKELNDLDPTRKNTDGPSPVKRWFQEQVLGFGLGVPHVANILRRVAQQAPGGVLNPKGWVDAWRVAFSKELRDRGVKGLDDPTFDMLAQHGAITTGEASNLKSYLNGNLNPARWVAEGTRKITAVGHKVIYDPKALGGFGGADQRARVWLADALREREPGISDNEIANRVRTALGDYARQNWTERQKAVAPFMMFPGWDFSSMRWVLKNPIKTTVAPAVMVWALNRAVNLAGGNRDEDRNDIMNVHVGGRAYGLGLVREPLARNIGRPLLNAAQSLIGGEGAMRATSAAARGVVQGLRSGVGMLRPDLGAAIGLATNTDENGDEIVSGVDQYLPGTVLPSKALEKQAEYAAKRAYPPVGRLLDSGGHIDLPGFVGGNLGVPNFQSDAETRLHRNLHEASEVKKAEGVLKNEAPFSLGAYMTEPNNQAAGAFAEPLQALSQAVKAIDAALPKAKTEKERADLKAKRATVLDAADKVDAEMTKLKRATPASVHAPVPGTE